MRRFASDTSVSPERTQGEIVDVLKRYKATDYMTGWMGGKALVAFRIRELSVRFLCVMPDVKDKEFTHSARGARTPQQIVKAWEQAVRQRWRALLLIIKAKMEAVQAGISSVEEEFLANVVTPRGTTIGQELLPQLPEIRRGADVQLLPALPAPKPEV